MEDWGQNEQEYFPLKIPQEYLNLSSETTGMSVRDFWQRYLAHELILEPGFQRHYVWDPTRASRYIESLLLGLPIPAIFLAQEQDSSWTVIDGHQRLETLFRYLQPLLPGPTKAVTGRTISAFSVLPPLRLRALKFLADLNGHDITALNRADRAKLWDCVIPVIKLPASVHPDIKYELFARLNQGSMSLNAQELRNCLYRGRYNQLIIQLGESREFLQLWGKTQPDRRMAHVEMALRFFALLHRRGDYRRPYQNFLNDEMGANRDVSLEQAKQFKEEFTTALRWVDRIFSKESFFLFQVGNPDDRIGRWRRHREKLVYEVEMVGFGQFGRSLDTFWSKSSSDDRELFRVELRRQFIDVMVNPRFTSLLQEGTTDPTSLHGRFELWNHVLERAIHDAGKVVVEASKLHDQLRRTNVCARCPTQVSPDDATWLFVEGNEQIVHRFCKQLPL
jgi:hypothetical protein